MFRLLITLVLLLILMVFAANNSHPITVDLWPSPYEITLPAIAIFYLLLFFGIFIGYMIKSVKKTKSNHSVEASSTNIQNTP